MASGIVRAAIVAELKDEECSFLYTERGKNNADLSRKLLERVEQNSNGEVFNNFCQELMSTIQT